MKSVVAGLLNNMATRLSRGYVPERYWEARAAELIATYDAPDTWAGRGWPSQGQEPVVVRELLARYACRSAFVVGTGTGRQYEFLAAANILASGIDIAPTLVDICVKRFPNCRTSVDSIVGASLRHMQCDAVLSSFVLQHIPPDQIGAALTSVRALARRLVILRETTRLSSRSSYQFAHNYGELMTGWELVYRSTTDEWKDVRIELVAWLRSKSEPEKRSLR